MQQRIITEGLDGSGKSTLIKTIQDYFPSDVVTIPGFKHSGATNYESWLRLEFHGNQVRPVKLHDRFLYSELIYGPLIRGRVDIDPVVSQAALHMLRENAFLIYCRIPYSKIVETVTAEPQMDGVLEKLVELYDEYERVMIEEVEHYKNRFVIWDFTRATTTQAAVKNQVLKPLEGYLNG